MGWIVEIENGGHMVMMEEPQRTAEALCQLLQKVNQS
jgi:pimeloyl-ACP methyl ester carboxylesterase